MLPLFASLSARKVSCAANTHTQVYNQHTSICMYVCLRNVTLQTARPDASSMARCVRLLKLLGDTLSSRANTSIGSLQPCQA